MTRKSLDRLWLDRAKYCKRNRNKIEKKNPKQRAKHFTTNSNGRQKISKPILSRNKTLQQNVRRQSI